MATDRLHRLDKYVYTKLKDPENIRILAVRSAPPDIDLIDCTLFEKGLKDAEYEALSWCWGDRKATRRIQITDSTGTTRYFSVPIHLYEGLKALRLDHKERHLWVDALCFDQDDLQERNTQVPRMDQIYGNATNVCIWLGPPDGLLTPSKIDMAFDFIKELLALWNYDDLLEQEIHMQSWEALLEIMKAPWFSRRWVVQEISLAKKATIHCGARKADWDDFADAVSLFVQVEETTQKLSKLAKQSSRESVLPDDRFEEVHQLGASLLVKTTKDLFRRSTWGRHYKQLTLESLVSRLALFRSSQPRDTIYGLLAMARDTQPYADEAVRYLDPKERELIERVAALFPSSRRARYEVRYESPTIEVYREFIAFSIRNADPTRALDIICRPFAYTYNKAKDWELDKQKLAAMTQEDKTEKVPLPTWIPTVANLPYEMQSADSIQGGSQMGKFFHDRMRRQYGDSLVGPPEARNYSAAGSRRFDKGKLAFRKSQQDNYYSMFTEGFVLDTVKKRSGVANSGRIPYDWFELLGWTDRTQDPPEKTRFDQFWRTMVANRDPRGVDPPIYYRRACERALRDFTAASTFMTDEYIIKGKRPVQEYFRRVQATIWERCLIETTNQSKINPATMEGKTEAATTESRLGLAHRSVEVGDKICILYGCSVPVIMRRIDKKESEIRREKEEDEEEAHRLRKLAFMKLKEIHAKRKNSKVAHTPTESKGPAVPEQPDKTASKTTSNSDPRSKDPVTQNEEKQKYLKKLDDQLAEHKSKKKAEQALWDRFWAWMYKSRHWERTLLLVLVSIWIEIRGDTATANLLRLAAATYFTTYSSSPIADPEIQWMISLSGTLIIVLLMFYSAFRYSDRMQATWDTAAVYLTFVAAFPQVLPRPFRRTFNRARDQFERVLDEMQESTEKKKKQESAGEKPKTWRDPVWRGCGIVLNRFRSRKRVVPEVAPRANHFYRIIGECYIHGMMEGEAIEWQNQKGIKSEVFEIR